MCVVHPSNSSSSGRGEVRALSSAEQSNLSSVRVCGHNYTESSNFSHIPTVCLDTSQPTSSFLLCLSHSLQVYKLDLTLLLFCEINSNFASAAARCFTGIIQMEGAVVVRLNEVAGIGLSPFSTRISARHFMFQLVLCDISFGVIETDLFDTFAIEWCRNESLKPGNELAFYHFRFPRLEVNGIF